ncbi:hypothetical protein [Spirosoma endbachense]|uniref:WD40 repeat domain-containing protein n=1 Tax=Spirosoma endbachense TaxID=2666025 RepID=A0A6P1VZV4_9BACT|nr:hypothetical protein [Spirosoma endbachense]QHV97317.1 hypothetical protein GJR95_20920 [Spirosoma endbachense]
MFKPIHFIWGLLSTLLLIIGKPAVFAQNRASSTPVPSTGKAGALKSEDFKYYAILRRTNMFQPSQYSLKGYPPSGLSTQAGLQTGIVVVDIRTMKEVAWWPEGTTFLHDNSIYTTTNSSLGTRVIKVSTNGTILYNKLLNLNKNGIGSGLTLSADLLHVYYLNNGDAWIGDFNIETGAVSNVHQVTQTGVIQGGETYMRQQTLLAGGYIINTQDGTFEQCCKYGFVPISSKATRFVYASGGPFGKDDKVWSLETRKPVFGFPGGAEHWLNAEQTKLIRQASNGYQIIDLSPIKSNAVNWKVTAYKHPTYLSTIWTSAKARLSPNGKYLFQAGGEGPTSGLYIHDSETYKESFLPMNLKKNMWRGANYAPEAFWTDNSHLIFKADEGSIVNGEMITTANQGTYIIDLNTKKAKRITPYLIDVDKDKVLRFADAEMILFQANNNLFTCSSNGDNLKQVTSLPNLYSLEYPFLDDEAR